MLLKIIQRVTTFLVSGQITLGLDLLYESLDDFLCEHRFGELNETLGVIDVKKSPLHLLIGLLVTTSRAKDKLPNRKIFYRGVLEYLGNEDGLLDDLE